MRLKTLLAAIAVMASVTPTYAAEKLDSVPNFRRSSLYTFLIRSDAQDAKLDTEVVSSNLVTGLVGAVKETVKKDTAATPTVKRSELAQRQFLNVEIPAQFNNHNLETRVLDFDKYKVTKEEVDAAALEQGVDNNSKKKKVGGFAKGLAASALGGSSGSQIINVDTVDKTIPAVVKKFYTEQNTAPQLVAKWFGYKDGKYDETLELIKERGLQDASEAAKAEAGARARGDAKLMDAGQELISNTFVLGVNLRYRSYAAIIEEAQQAANAVGSMFGSYGALASQAAGAIANAAAGKGFAVQAYTYLYQLEWDKEKLDLFYSQYWDKPLEELIASGFCTLKFIGKDKAVARVSASGFSNKKEEELVKDAVENAIDKAIVKLQVKHEVFRTKTPIYQISEDGKSVYAQIGTKEGVAKGDEYDILEATEEKGETVYKVIGKVKAVEGAIWNNEAGAEDAAKQAEAEGDKKAAEQLAAINLKATKFEVKKGKDLYPGLLLRLSKKK